MAKRAVVHDTPMEPKTVRSTVLPPEEKAIVVAFRSGGRDRGGRLPARHQGQGVYAYVTLNAGVEPTQALRKELVAQVRTEVGPIAAWAPGLPKTRSGQIMRRILRRIAEDEVGSLGDSTLADPAVVDDLVRNRGACLG